MVKRLIIKLIIEVSSTVAKSFVKAYQQSAKQSGGKAGNPFTEFLNQTMQAANLTHKPMTREEAFKIQLIILLLTLSKFVCYFYHTKIYNKQIRLQKVDYQRKNQRGERKKTVLQLVPEKANPEDIIRIYWRQFHKNDPVKGGSFFLQSMLHNAKCELMKDFADVNEKEIMDKIKKEGESQKGEEEEKKDETKVDEKNEEKKQD